MTRLDDIRARAEEAKAASESVFPRPLLGTIEHDRAYLLDLVERAVPLVEAHTWEALAEPVVQQWLRDVRGEEVR
jgi:hypothetical protein